MAISMLSTDPIRAHAKRLAAFAVSLVFAIAALPALAQQQQAAPNVPAAPYGYGHMMWGGPWGGPGGAPGWGWHPFMIVGPIFVLLAIIGIMVIFVWLVRWATRGYPFHGHGSRHFHGGCPWCDGPGRGRAALDILEERFARGEIDKGEFEEKRKLLGR
ncbi:MAG TPA: SHOCT domain-containing protein [Stellaceae bacterium]|nr:SHOCT domain-containing protein [Stellaceae bacterium]